MRLVTWSSHKLAFTLHEEAPVVMNTATLLRFSSRGTSRSPLSVSVGELFKFNARLIGSIRQCAKVESEVVKSKRESKRVITTL